jgi:hypothetical protein
VPENHWVYETLLTLHRENVIVSPLATFFRGGRPSSRMDIANWAVHATSAMLSRLEGAELEVTKGENGIRDAKAQASALGKLAKETDNLAKMAFLFEPELKRRHIDAMALRRDMLSFPKRLERIAAQTPIPAPFVATVQRTDLYRQFPNIPENHWAHQTLLNLRESNIIHLEDGFSRYPRHTAIEFARATFEACTEFRYRLARLLSPGSTDDATYKQMKVLHKDIANLVRMTDEFAPELKWMHVDPVPLKKEMESLLRFVEEGRRNDGGG